jgi:hypothetical protein
MAVVALLLVGLMVYALLLGSGGLPSLAPSTESRLVAVYFPDTASWQEFRRALVETAGRGLATVVERTAGTIRLRCMRSGREIRFQWYDEPGLLAARASLQALLESDDPPLAVIGSTNTALTTALADELADAGKRQASHNARSSPLPMLLIPAASGVHVPAPGGDEGAAAATGHARRRLLEIYPRSLRFCLNNQRMTDLVLDVAAALDGGGPSRSLIIVDPNDPFSVDLADCFETSIKRLHPRLAIERHEWRPSPGRAFGTLEGEAARMLEALKGTAENPRPGSRDWLVLTIQGSPARQVLQSLRDLAQGRPLRVLAGDGIGRATLQSFAGELPFPLCASSSVSADVPAWLESSQGQVGQVQAEIAAALLSVFDESPPGDDLFPTLAALRWSRDSAHAVGRSLEFVDRDRAGDDIGQVLEIVPGSPEVLSHSPMTLNQDPSGLKRQARSNLTVRSRP